MKISIGTKLFLWFLIPIILVFVIGITTYINSKRIDKAAQSLHEDWKRADSNMELRIGLGLLGSCISGFAESAVFYAIKQTEKSTASYEAANELLKTGKFKFIEGFNKLKELEDKGPAAYRLQYKTEEIKCKFETIVATLEIIRNKYADSNIMGALSIKEKAFDPYYNELQTVLLEEAEEFADEIIESSANRITEIASKSVKESIVSSIIIVVAGILFVIVLNVLIKKPIVKLRDAAVKIGKGDFRNTVDIKCNDEIGELARVFNHMMKELKTSQMQLVHSEKLRVMGMMTAGIAHELNNPMMGILNYVQYSMKHLSDNERILKILKDAEIETQRCIDLIKNMLNFSYKHEGTIDNDDKCNCVDVVDNSFVLLAHSIERKEIQLKKDYTGDIPEVAINSSELQQVLINLIVNAVDALDGRIKKQIAVDIFCESELVQIKINDNGRGIDTENSERIFDPFFTTKPQGVGTGLGLPISHKIVNDIGGDILCESRPNIGTTFTIKLPVQK